MFVQSFEDSKIIFENNLVWYNNNGEMWLVNDFTGNPHVVLPNDYHGQSYSVGWMVYTYEDYIQSITFSDNVKDIYSEAIGYCANLEYIKLPSNLPHLRDVIWCDCPNIKTIIFPENVEYIERCFFEDAQIESVVFPATLKTLEYGVIGKQLKHVVFTNGNINIDSTETPFYSSNLDSVDFAANITVFNTKMFNSSAIVRTMIIRATVPPTVLGTQTINGLEAIYVPAESVDLYKSAEGWSQYADLIQPIQ